MFIYQIHEVCCSFFEVYKMNDSHILLSGYLAADVRRRQSCIGRSGREVPRRSSAGPVASLDSAAADLPREKRRKAHLESAQHGRTHVPAGRILPHQVKLSFNFMQVFTFTPLELNKLLLI